MANIESVKLPDNSEYNIVDVVSAKGSQPNLLINGWFTVNQRGVSSGRGNTYIADRWVNSNSGNESISRDSNNIITSTCYYPETWFIRQPIEYTPSIMGKTVTLSAIINGDIYSYTFDMPQSIPGSSSSQKKDLSISDVALRVYFDTTKFIVGVFHTASVETYTTVTIKAVKLEIGSTSTLHLDTAPDYTTERLKCRRYFKRFQIADSDTRFMTGWIQSTSYFLMMMDFSDVPFRDDTYTKKISGSFQVKIPGGSTYNISNLVLNDARTEFANVRGEGATFASSDVGKLAVLSGTNAYIEFDDEL